MIWIRASSIGRRGHQPGHDSTRFSSTPWDSTTRVISPSSSGLPASADDGGSLFAGGFVDVGDENGGTFVCELFRDGATDAVGGAGDDGDFVPESVHESKN